MSEDGRAGDSGVAALLGSKGPLAGRIAGFRPRPGQQAMAAEIAGVIERREVLVAEAGTGTGKTYAYLVPAIASGRRVLVSTGTLALQDQLFHRDLPRLREALRMPVRVSLLKGRANYLCRYRLDLAEQVPASGARDAVRLQAVSAWAARTESGDIAECHEVRPADPWWPTVTSTVDNCLGAECPAWSQCHVVRARRSAQEADLVVINHHLLFSDFLLRQQGGGELLPEVDAVIVDEAHQLPELATRFFGLSVSAGQLRELAGDVRRALQASGARMPSLVAACQQLEVAVEGFGRRLGLGERTGAWAAEAPGAASALARIRRGIGLLEVCLAEALGAHRDLDQCLRRTRLLMAHLAGFAAGSSDGEGADEADAATLEAGQAPSGVDGTRPRMEGIRWLEVRSGGRFLLHVSPMDFAAAFRASIDRYEAGWVFASATLAVGGRFDHFTARLGIADARTACWDSPFPYERNALCYLPPGVSDPRNWRSHAAAVVAAARPVIAGCGGGVFMLFTSHRGLAEAARLLRLEPPGVPLFVQGELPHAELLARFREAGTGVLLATASFWEGVDVPGPALSCVIIDKLPFAPPDDPLAQARRELIRARGGNAFREEVLPAAIITLRQGAGRLIRHERDRGVLVLCDPRIRTAPYGRRFLDGLPPMPRTGDLGRVLAFLAAVPGELPAGVTG